MSDLVRLRLAGGTAAIGNGLTGVVIPVVLSLTFPGWGVGFALGMLSTGMLLSFAHGGAVADRKNRISLIVKSDLVRALMNLIVVAGVLAVEAFRSPILGGVLVTSIGCFGNGLMAGYFRPAQSSLWASVVPPATLQHELQINSLINRSGLALGGAVGATALALGVGVWGLIVDAATFLITATLVRVIRDPRPTEPNLAATRLWHRLSERLRVDRQWQEILTITGRSVWLRTWVICAVNASWAMAVVSVAGPIVLVESFNRLQIGIFQASSVVALVIGAFIAWRIKRVPVPGLLDVWGGVASALAYIAVPVLGASAATALRASAYGTTALAGPSIGAYVGHQFPEGERGRVFAAVTGASSVLAPVGMLVGGLLVSMLPPAWVLITGACAAAVFSAIPLVRPSYWTLS